MAKTNAERQAAYRKRVRVARKAIPELKRMAQEGVALTTEAISLPHHSDVRFAWSKAQQAFLDALAIAGAADS